jgi:hypothetical protein
MQGTDYVSVSCILLVAFVSMIFVGFESLAVRAVLPRASVVRVIRQRVASHCRCSSCSGTVTRAAHPSNQCKIERPDRLCGPRGPRGLQLSEGREGKAAEA